MYKLQYTIATREYEMHCKYVGTFIAKIIAQETARKYFYFQINIFIAL